MKEFIQIIIDFILFIYFFNRAKTNDTFEEVPKERILLSHDPDGNNNGFC